jgi:hypothetical protein
LPPIDIINLIARGTTTEGAPQSFGANTVLAQGLSHVESTVGSNISKLTGISGLQIDPMIGGNNSNPSARIGIQKRVTKNFIFSFSTDVTQPQSEIVQGEYQLNKRWSLTPQKTTCGSSARGKRLSPDQIYLQISAGSWRPALMIAPPRSIP